LGLASEAFEHRLRIRRPILPEFVHWMELHRVSIGPAQADLRFDNGKVRTTVLEVRGELDIAVEEVAPEDAKRWRA